MNSQNILKFWGSRLGLKLDSSEFYDYEIGKTELDYDADVLDLVNSIEYSTLVIDSTGLLGKDCLRNNITLSEFDNTSNDSLYPYSGFTWSLPYSAFTFTLNNSDTILQNDVYEFIDNDGLIHYFVNSGYNETLSNPFSLDVSGFTTGTTISCIGQFVTGGTIDSTICCPLDDIPDSKPWAYQINHGDELDDCDFLIKRRPEKGWTLDFVFNKDGFDWSDGNVFYYLGVRGDDDIANYGDNNLSFKFTDDGRIQWSAIRYSGECSSGTTYTDTFYTSSGRTDVLCVDGTSEDFNVTITFDRYNHYTLDECSLGGMGGWYDLITGRTMLNTISEWITGSTPTYEDVEILNEKWFNSRKNRLGVLRIYLNGRVVYKLDDWEEVIPSTRGYQPFIQSWGSGTIGSGGVHDDGTTCFNMKRIKYFEEPLPPIRVRHHYLVDTKPNYSIVECDGSSQCVDDVISFP